DVALMAERLRLTLDEELTTRDQVEGAVKALGFGIAPKGGPAPKKFVLPDNEAGGPGIEAPSIEPVDAAAGGAPRTGEPRAPWHETRKGRLVIATALLLLAAWAVRLAGPAGA